MHEFTAPRWLRSPHLQTLGAAFPLFAPPRSHGAHDDELRIPIGGDHRLHARAWWADAREPRPCVVLLHGIGGSAESRYVVRAGVALHRAGYHVVRLDLRGAGASAPDAPTLYHAGLTEDLDAVVSYVAQKPRVSGVVLLGFSGGGSIALKRAGEWGTAAPRELLGVASISAPLDYTRVAPWMDTLGRLPYRLHVLRGLAKGAREFARLHPDRTPFRAAAIKRTGSFRDYDATVIVPMHGFAHVDAYYEAASSGPWLSRVEVPALLVHADDDPMVPGETVRPWLARVSPAVRVATSPHGGHIGWVTGFDEASWITTWAMKKVLAFLADIAPLEA